METKPADNFFSKQVEQKVHELKKFLQDMRVETPRTRTFDTPQKLPKELLQVVSAQQTPKKLDFKKDFDNVSHLSMRLCDRYPICSMPAGVCGGWHVHLCKNVNANIHMTVQEGSKLKKKRAHESRKLRNKKRQCTQLEVQNTEQPLRKLRRYNNHQANNVTEHISMQTGDNHINNNHLKKTTTAKNIS